MKKKIGMLAAAVAGIAMAGSASAAMIDFGGYTGAITIHYTNLDMGKLYTADAATPGAADAQTDPTPLTGSPDSTEDFWGIARISLITQGDGGPEIYNRNFASYELNAIFWNGRDIQVDVEGNTQTIWSDNILMAVYSNTKGAADGADLGFLTNPSITPDDRLANSGGFAIYPGINDATQMLLLTFVGHTGEFPENTDAEFKTTITGTTTTGFTGGGNLFLDAAAIGGVTGAQNHLIADQGTEPDARVNFSVTPDGQAALRSPDWTVASTDPLRATVVPTPSVAAMGLVGLGSLLAGRARRRK